MNPTGIEYLTRAWNPVTGCENWHNSICGGGGKDFQCWAKRITERFPERYPRGFEPTFYLERIGEPVFQKKPTRIGVAFMGDLFGDWVPRWWIDNILRIVHLCPQHTFVFLTKCPWNLIQYNPWPRNCWVGTTVVGDGPMTTALTNLACVDAPIRFVSMEPLLGAITMRSHSMKGIVDWIILGAATNPSRPLRLEWVEEVEDAAKRAGVPIFEKNNLAKLLKRPLRQEYPYESFD